MSDNLYEKIKRQIRTHSCRGYKGIDYKLTHSQAHNDELMENIKARFIENGCTVIDWLRDDPYGLGIGVNKNGSKVSDDNYYLTINWI